MARSDSAAEVNDRPAAADAAAAGITEQTFTGADESPGAADGLVDDAESLRMLVESNAVAGPSVFRHPLRAVPVGR